MPKVNRKRLRIVSSRFLPARGFNLIEILIVIFILGCLFGFIWPEITKASWRFGLEKAVWEVHATMNYLKYRALKDSFSYRLKIYFNGYAVEKYNPDDEVWLQVEKSILSGVTLEATNSPTFSPAGTVSNMATITISNQAGSYRLSIAITGRIKIIPLTKGSG